ncbi:DUF485 domain-containing protein [Sodalis ligni]|uniref:Uncharacterized membrane protein (DUF485 family) n=1 Tax=Sodalis ligni TaxID=2697027 RepID=A0A4R1NEB5_9GAMM|nr:DUF485 domain-containing protein [Sodalis ligni]QWA10890.1 DUF485 domain-containing protein [Sodalis ligni]TCL05753.1 uncharacterized membrane protein (DUF485 family) [Sodalis ligni]
MNDIIYQRIEKNPHFQELVKKRQHFAMLLTLIMLVLYYGFILLIAFAPGWLGTPIYEGTSVTRGIPLGIGLIIMSFILTAIYVVRANGEFDRLTQQLLREVRYNG